jgi:LPXTG-motif cell wall-anchored protein
MTADQLLAQTQLLTSVLTYHVVAGEVPAATVVGLTEATTLNGAKVSIKVVGGSVFLNDTVKVTTTDIQACNGIIHVIDGVLLPPTAPSGEMPATGAASEGVALGAAALLLGGAGALLISRRRPTAA